MVAKTTGPLFKWGDRVKVRYSGFPSAKIVELRGPLGPGGTQIYRIRVEQEGPPDYLEVREDQMIPIPAEPMPSAKRKGTVVNGTGVPEIAPAGLGEVPGLVEKKVAEPSFKLGDWVTIRHWPDARARVVELRGPLAPGGVQVYGIRVGRKPHAHYIEVREDQMIPLPAEKIPRRSSKR